MSCTVHGSSGQGGSRYPCGWLVWETGGGEFADSFAVGGVVWIIDLVLVHNCLPIGCVSVGGGC